MSFIVTKKWILDNQTERGGLTGAQLRTLGMTPMKLPSGWMQSLEGKEITIQEKEYFEGEAKHTFTKQHARKLRRLEEQKDFGLEVVAQKHYRTIEGLVYNRKWSDEFVASKEFLRTYEWAKTRMQVIATQGNRCKCCGASPDSGAMMCVDHIKPRKFFPSLALDPNNLQVLCDLCNFGKGSAFAIDWRNGKPPKPSKKRSKSKVKKM